MASASLELCNFLYLYLQTSFFRQHNCDTTDTQLKYKSRAAQLYRDKLHGEAAKAMRMHGTKLFIDAPQNSAQDDTVEVEAKEDDFFEQHENEASTSVQLPQNVKLAVSFQHLLTINKILYALLYWNFLKHWFCLQNIFGFNLLIQVFIGLARFLYQMF